MINFTVGIVSEVKNFFNFILFYFLLIATKSDKFTNMAKLGSKFVKVAE